MCKIKSNNNKSEHFTSEMLKRLDGSILPPKIISYLEKNCSKMDGVKEVVRMRTYRHGVFVDELIIELSDCLIEIESSKNVYPC